MPDGSTHGKHTAEQFPLDLAGDNLETRLNDQWRRNMEADAHNWTPEAMAMHWSGVRHWEDWNSQPKYQRDQIVQFWEWEQSDLIYRQEYWDQWEYLCEVFYPDGTSKKCPPLPHFQEVDWPKRPHIIRPFATVWKKFTTVDWALIEERKQRAKAIADRVHAAWSAGRECMERVFDPYVASEVAAILGRPFEQSMPEDRSGIPLDWQLLYALQEAMRK